MGCSDSMMLNQLNTPTNRVINDPHQYPEPQGQIPEFNTLPSSIKQPFDKKQERSTISNNYYNAHFNNSYEYLQQLYTICQGDLDKFFHELQQKISDIYMEISKETLEQMNQNILINNQSKIKISEEILWFNLNILKVLSRKAQHKFNPTIFKQINKLQKNLVGYLKMKYPRGGQSFVPGDLMAIFKQFDLTQDIEFDILKNSNTYFGNQDDKTLSREIKQFLNKLISQLDQYYPKFQRIMQEQVFVIVQNGQKRSLNYKIGRKIPQNVSKYSQMQTNTLQINSPQVFRVIIKWMMYLQQILLEPNQHINKKKNFKSFVQQSSNGKKVFDEVNQDQYFDMINYQLIEKIEKQKINYNQQNLQLLKDIDVFNSHLLKILDTSIRKQKFVPLKQMEIIKYSNLNAKFIAWILSQKLMLSLKKLISIGRSFENTKAMINLDLITFRVADLMRGMVTGNKKQILAVYNNMKKLQKQGHIKIIRIKNRLGTSLNDVMIIFAMTDTFLICQIQLILSDGTQKVNQKYKNIQTLNHFFYQLQRSPFGILSQIAVLLAYKDSKVSYEDKITFEINKADIYHCQQSHPNFVTQLKQQTKPFMCSKCTKFYFKFQNLFLMKSCFQCNIFVCGGCLFENNKDLLQNIIFKQINTQIQKGIANTLCKLRNISSSNTASSVLKIFHTTFNKLSSLFGFKKVSMNKFIQYLNTKAKNARQNLYFVLINFKAGSVSLKCLKYKPAFKQIQNPFNLKQNFRDKEYIYYSKYDMILFFEKSKYILQFSTSLEDSILHLFAPQSQAKKRLEASLYGVQFITLKIGDFKLLIDMQKIITKTIKYEAEYQTVQQDQTNQQTLQMKNPFKYQSIHEITNNLPDLAGAKSILKLSELGVLDEHLSFFKQIDWVANIKQLKLSKNYITNVQLILKSCTELQRLYINDNWIKSLSFQTDLKNIQIINATNNQIKEIQGLQKINKISKLLLENNQLEQFPISNLPNLKVLNLNFNPIKNYDSIILSTFPDIQQLFIQKSDNQYIQDKHTVAAFQNVTPQLIVPFSKLKSINGSMRCYILHLGSTKLERVSLNLNAMKQININNLQSLKYLDLKLNQIRSLQFLFSQKNHYQNNVIIEINVSDNFIENFPLAKSNSLKTMNIKKNQLKAISNLLQSQLSSLQNLNLCANKIQKLQKLKLPSLKELNLAQNCIKQANQFKQSDLNLLEVLDLRLLSNMRNFPQLNLINLKNIQMSESFIYKMGNLSTSILPNLQSLNLSNSSIKQFPLIRMQSLAMINLNGCLIQNFKLFQKCILPNLIQLNMSHLTLQQKLPDYQANQQNKIANLQSNNPDLQAQQTSNLQVKQKQNLQTKQNQNLNKFTWILNLPKLKKLNLNSSCIRNSQGFQNSILPCLQQLDINYCIFDKCPFINFQQLKEIQAKSCQITKIQQFLGKNLQNLQILNIDQNLIQKMNCLLPKKLKILSINNNQMKQFNHSSQFNQLQQLILSHNMLAKFPVLKCKKLNNLRVQGIRFQTLKLLEACNFPILQGLTIQSCKLLNQPFPILKFESVKSLYFKSNQITDISNLSKSVLPMVQDINFSQNQIQSVPKIQFPKLKYLRLNNNKIKDIDELQKSVLPQLQILQLQKNQIKSLPLLPFPKMMKIFMEYNDCSNVQRFNKSPIKALQILNICYANSLTQFPIINGSFSELYANQTLLNDVAKLNQYKDLKIIQLNGNKIKYLPALNHRNMTQIQFQDNEITDIDDFAKQQYHFCTQFSIKGNQLTKAPLLKMQRLSRCYFNCNPIEEADQFSKSDLPNLTMVTFQSCNLKSLKKMPFPSLREIYLTNNLQLSELTCFNLAQYPALTMIVAASTAISKVQVLPKMQKLQKMWVSNSRLQDLIWLSKSVVNVPKLYFINASDNKIKQLPSFKGAALNSIYIINNPIQTFDKFLADGKQQLSKYYTCNLSIKWINDEDFNNKVQLIRKEAGQNVYYSISRCY